MILATSSLHHEYQSNHEQSQVAMAMLLNRGFPSPLNELMGSKWQLMTLSHTLSFHRHALPAQRGAGVIRGNFIYHPLLSLMGLKEDREKRRLKYGCHNLCSRSSAFTELEPLNSILWTWLWKRGWNLEEGRSERGSRYMIPDFLKSRKPLYASSSVEYQ